ncbi:MAG: extracellular solute-binding protein, partial [Actinomycetota bacterium]|nr:extracellular solute-binding protein [Actinomycetota bacterium]
MHSPTAGPRRRCAAARSTAACLLAALVLALSLTACSSSAHPSSGSQPSGSSSSIAGQTITLYNGQHEQTTNALVAAFEKLTGVTVKVRSSDEDTLAQQMLQEGSHSPADAFYTENSPPLVKLDKAGLLASVDPATLATVPSAYNASDKSWVGISVRVSELIYNTDALTPADLPTTVLGLADPKWKGKLDIAPSETDFQPIVTSVDAAVGDAATVAWLKGLKSNAATRLDPSNETLVNNVNSGTTQLGLINHYYWYRLRAEKGATGMHSALATLAPRDNGYLLDVSGAGVLRSSSHQQAAQALVRFLVSAPGQ